MAKKQKAIRGKFSDEKYLGSEPDLRGEVTNAQIIAAYNWYNYFYDASQAKSWIIEYLKEFHKTEKELIKNVNRIDDNYCRTSGWSCRILLVGGNLPEELKERNLARIRSLAASSAAGANRVHGESSSTEEGQEASQEEVNHADVADSTVVAARSDSVVDSRMGSKLSDERGNALENGVRESGKANSGSGTRTGPTKAKSNRLTDSEVKSRGKGGLFSEGTGNSESNSSTNSSAQAGTEEAGEEEKENTVRHSPKSTVISIQERIVNRTNELIADIEVELDKYYRTGTQFKMGDWLIRNDVKPAIAARIAEHYKPLYSEAYDALNGKDEQLKEGYSHYKKPQLKAYVEFLKSIVSAAETRSVVMKASRKPRKKKEKPASALVSKLKYKVKDDTLKLDSVDPKQIIGCNQLWVFNTKYRTLGVYNAMGPAGLSVKGSSVVGFDEKTSLVKTLRKPAEQLKTLNEGGKIVLRKFMDSIKCKPKTATGRINNETVLVRIIK